MQHLNSQSYSQAGHKKSLTRRRGGGARRDSTCTYDIVRIRIVRVRMIYHYFALIYFLFVSFLFRYRAFLSYLQVWRFFLAQKNPRPHNWKGGRGFVLYGTAAYAGVITRGSVGSGGNTLATSFDSVR